MKVRKPTPDQKAAYMGIHPLYGFVNAQGSVNNGKGDVCRVEYLGEGKEAPNYEVLAPAGMQFAPDGVLTLVCFSLADMAERLANSELEYLPDFN